MSELRGLATGIGSLPHKDADSALDLVFKYTPQIPFWPQLPKRDIREGMVAQFSEGLPCIKVTDKGVVFCPEDKENKLEKFYERIIKKDIEYFSMSADFAPGLYTFKERLKKLGKNYIKRIKCQITGPFSFAASIKDEKGVALLHDPLLMQAIIEGLKMKALWQIRFFEGLGKIIVFIDEPYLACLGSAYTPINREDVVGRLDELAKFITDSGNVQLGVHCCGNTDWSIFTDIKNIDIISFDAFNFLDRLVLYADSLKRFFQKGGLLCWGIVPTQEFTGKETVDLLVTRVKDGINTLIKKGLDKDLLLKNLLLSPSCGLGTLDCETADRIFSFLFEVSSRIKDSFK